jgi:hypothetical protein
MFAELRAREAKKSSYLSKLESGKSVSSSHYVGSYVNKMQCNMKCCIRYNIYIGVCKSKLFFFVCATNAVSTEQLLRQKKATWQVVECYKFVVLCPSESWSRAAEYTHGLKDIYGHRRENLETHTFKGN